MITLIGILLEKHWGIAVHWGLVSPPCYAGHFNY